MRSITYSHTEDRDPIYLPEWRLDPAIHVIKEETYPAFRGDTVGHSRTMISHAFIDECDVTYIMLKYPDVELNTLMYGT